jgi:hypothetical protein
MRYLIPLLLLSTAAVAQQQSCGTSQKVHDFLSNDYGEKPFIEMKDERDRQFIMYVNPDTGSWTVVLLTDQGTLCGVSSGKGMIPATKRFETTPPKKKEDPS